MVSLPAGDRHRSATGAWQRHRRAGHPAQLTAEIRAGDGGNVPRIELVHPPRAAVALPGEGVDAPLDVARRQLDQGLLAHSGLRGCGDGREVRAAHVVEDPAHQPCGQIRPHRPGQVDVAEAEREVRHVAEHGAPPQHVPRGLDRPAVDAHGDVAQRQHAQPGRRHHDVGRQHRPGPQPDALGDEAVDVIGDHVDLLALDRLEQVRVGRDAHPLVPRRVRRSEVLTHRVVADPACGGGGQQRPRPVREPSAVVVEPGGVGGVPRPDDPVRPPGGQPPPELVGEPVPARLRADPRRRALQHGHLRRVARHRGDHGDRGRAAADHDDTLAGVVEFIGPELRMGHCAGEGLDARELRVVSALVVVVTGVHVQE
jgi:hypothetical protein